MNYNKFKRIFCGAICVLIISGCGSNNIQEKTEEPVYADEAFVKDMSEGLQARWELTNKDEEKM